MERKNPKAAAAATRALLKGAKWVETNPRAAARLSVEKKYLASNPELNTVAIGNLRYIPSVVGAETAIKTAAEEMQKAGMLSASTNLPELRQKAFAKLEGVDDAWLKNLEVQKVAGGQIPADQHQRLLAELAAQKAALIVGTCCAPASKVARK